MNQPNARRDFLLLKERTVGLTDTEREELRTLPIIVVGASGKVVIETMPTLSEEEWEARPQPPFPRD